MVANFSLNTSEINKWEKNVLQKAHRVAFPLAIKGTLNTLAFNTMRESRETIREDFTNRNKWTERSVRVIPVKTLKIVDMQAETGSALDYMLDQEVGARRSSKGEHGLRIPTGAAAGQASLFPRKKTVKKSFRRGQMKILNMAGKGRGAKSKKQFLLMSIRVAALRGQLPFVFLQFGKKSGVYKVIPHGPAPSPTYRRGKTKFSRSFKWGRPKGTPGKETLKLIHSFGHRNIKIPASHWLSKSFERVAQQSANIFLKEADRVFNRFVR